MITIDESNIKNSYAIIIMFILRLLVKFNKNIVIDFS